MSYTDHLIKWERLPTPGLNDGPDSLPRIEVKIEPGIYEGVAATEVLVRGGPLTREMDKYDEAFGTAYRFALQVWHEEGIRQQIHLNNVVYAHVEAFLREEGGVVVAGPSKGKEALVKEWMLHSQKQGRFLHNSLEKHTKKTIQAAKAYQDLRSKAGRVAWQPSYTVDPTEPNFRLYIQGKFDVEREARFMATTLLSDEKIRFLRAPAGRHLYNWSDPHTSSLLQLTPEETTVLENLMFSIGLEEEQKAELECYKMEFAGKIERREWQSDVVDYYVDEDSHWVLTKEVALACDLQQNGRPRGGYFDKMWRLHQAFIPYHHTASQNGIQKGERNAIGRPYENWEWAVDLSLEGEWKQSVPYLEYDSSDDEVDPDNMRTRWGRPKRSTKTAEAELPELPERAPRQKGPPPGVNKNDFERISNQIDSQIRKPVGAAAVKRAKVDGTFRSQIIDKLKQLNLLEEDYDDKLDYTVPQSFAGHSGGPLRKKSKTALSAKKPNAGLGEDAQSGPKK